MLFLSISLVVGSTLEDVSYSIKQNGIMINLEYTKQISDDDIIGWKSDRGWVYLTLLGVRAPKNKSSQEDYSGIVRKIIIDDFDESTQLAILVKKPILGYDIINSKTSPSTIVFIHTEMKKSEVASLKQHIEKEGVSVFNVAKSSGFPKYNTNFRNAFDQARKELGPNAIFEYHGNLYTTNHPGEKESKSKSILMDKEIAPLKDGELHYFTLREMKKNSESDSLIEEVYINQSTGEIISEKIGDSISTEGIFKENSLNSRSRDDGWFSGDFPSYKTGDIKSPIKKQHTIAKDTLVTKERPVFAQSNSKKREKTKKWLGLFELFKPTIKTQSDKEQIKEYLADDESDTFTKLQTEYVPSLDQNIDIKDFDETIFTTSKTQLSDTNIVNQIEITNSSIEESLLTLQKEHIPTNFYSVQDTLPVVEYYESQTQAPDTNVVRAWFTDESIISDEYDVTHLQKQYIPLKGDNIGDKIIEDESLNESSPQMTQAPDTNVVRAWFTDESIISDEYDATHLQKQYIPLKDSNIPFDENDELIVEEALPQNPEYTDPFMISNRFKTRFNNYSIVQKSKKDKDIPFLPDSVDNNTWLSFFPLQKDSMKKTLKWNFKEEKEVPLFLQKEREALEYSSRSIAEHDWRKELPQQRPKSYPNRQADPGFMYYYNGGIKVESNMKGVPIYIDGKYVGETPLSKPIEVEPGWHQVSGFSPVYTHLAKKDGLQFVGYDSIIQNNESYGATTVYAESGKLETVMLKFNQMGDKPKKLSEIKGGINIALPMFTFVISMILWSI